MITIQFEKGWDANVIPHFPTHHTGKEKMISKILRKFDTAGYVAEMVKAPNPINSFNVVDHYCAKITSCNDDGSIQLNLSPVFHLCVTYPDTYAQKYGKHLNPRAVLGLVESSHSQEHTAFLLSIDAGMVFDSMENNKPACLYFNMNEASIAVTFCVLQEKREIQLQWRELQLAIMQNTEMQTALYQMVGDT